ncbi:MAG: HEAT repeat domain-containing protein, partial [Thermogemmata sp.]|nr:HEAT repeat domain-containing protein [Thermogemmata sp.]
MREVVGGIGIALLLFVGTARGEVPPPGARPLPEEFAQPQSPLRPVPFPVRLVDQGQWDPRLKGYFLPEGFRLEIVISEPEVVNPVGMTFAPDGSLFVLEWRPDPITGDRWYEVQEIFRFRDGSTRAVATMKKFTFDLVKLFRYNPATGRFHPPQVIIAEELPSSLLYHEGWLYVTGRGTVRRWRQSTAAASGGSSPIQFNQPWNVREVIAQGFCGFHHHQVSGLTLGNDGLLYITSGDDDNYVEGSDGSRATVLRTGAVFRCRPDGSRMEVFSIGYRNPYRDLAHDNKFNWFHADNDNEDGSKFMGCRIMHVAEGTDFGWRLLTGARCCRPDHTRGAIAGELPGKVPPMLKTGRGAPAGLLIYHDTRLPEQYRGLLYYPDVFRKLVRAYKTAPDGATFKITHEFEFLKSDDPLFRPCQMVIGPDGAIYVCDWRTDSGGAGKLSGDGQHGRIYRITWHGTANVPALPRREMDSWWKLRQLPLPELIEALARPDLTDRVEARKELVRRGPTARDHLLKALQHGKFRDQEDALLPALGVLMVHWNSQVQAFFLERLRDPSPDVRRCVIEGLALYGDRSDPHLLEELLKKLGDSEPAVRRAAALALGRIGGSPVPQALVNSYLGDLKGDPFLKDGYIRALERLGLPGIEAILTLAASGDRERTVAVDMFLALRSREAAQLLPQLLARPDLTVEQRAALVRSYVNYQLDPPISLQPLTDYLNRHPDEDLTVFQAAIDVYAVSGGDNTQPVGQLVERLLHDPRPGARRLALQAAEQLRLAALLPRLLPMVLDTRLPEADRLAALRAVRALNQPQAADALRTLIQEPHPAVLKVEALRGLMVIQPAEARVLAERLLDQSDPQLLAEAIQVLTPTKNGARLLAQRYLARQIPREYYPLITEALHKFADDPECARLRAEVLRGGLLLSLEPGQIHKIRQLVEEKGNPKRGREIYLNPRLVACASCHRLEGIGGAVGPDLTRLWDTMSLEKVLEAIVDPSREIKEGYQTYRLTTTQEQVFTGLKIIDNDREVVLRESTGRDVRIPRDQIESLTPLKVSLMPDNAVTLLTFDQFIDLLAFLKSRQEQETLRGLVVEMEATSLEGPVPATPAVPVPLRPDHAWRLLAAEPSGTFHLDGLLPEPQRAALLRVYVYSPQQQQVVLTVQHSVHLHGWLNQQGP